MKNVLFGLTLFCFLGCQSIQKKQDKTSTKNNALNRKWMLVELDTINKQKLIDNKVFIDLSKRENTGTAYAGCNNIGFKYTTKNTSKISFSDVISTRMYCEDTNNIEAALLDALNTCKSYELKGQFLYLTTTSKKTVKCIAEDWD